MTHAVALTGQWEGLRAFPRAQRTPDNRTRLESGLDRLGGLYERMAARAAMLQAGMDRLNGLRYELIQALDASEPDADLEPSLGVHWDGGWVSDDREADDAEKEPSLCGVTANWNPYGDTGDRESDLSWGGDYAGANQMWLTASVEGDDHEDREPSLSAVIMCHAGDQTGYRWIGGGNDRDLEQQCEDEGAFDEDADNSDREASLCGVEFGAPRPAGPGLLVRDLYALYDFEVEEVRP